MDEFSRNKWIEACQFEELGQKAILDEVARRIGVNTTVVFDLDSTLYEVAQRTHSIIREWIQSGHVLPTSVLTALQELKHENVGYSLKDTFESVGLDIKNKEVEKAWTELKDFWWDRFFSSEYLKFDVPYPGATEFVNSVHRLGAKIVYLTGRDEKKMMKGTIENLKRDGFPLEKNNIRLILKDNPTLADSEYKRLAAEKIGKETNVIASFENEPHNVVALYEIFPNALHVFMETICSDKPARALTGLYKISGFAC